MLLWALLPMHAQEEALVASNDSVDTLLEKLLPEANNHLNAHMNLEFYTSAAGYFTEGTLDEAAFKINRVRLEMYGRLNKHISYHWFDDKYLPKNIATQ